MLAFSEELEQMGLDASQRHHYTSKQQCALLLDLRHRTSGRTIVVANTHIACAYNDPDIQAAQLAILCRAIEVGMRASPRRGGALAV